MPRQVDLKGTPLTHCHATAAYGALLFTFPYAYGDWLHYVCNKDDNCSSYGSLKYVSDETHAKLEALTGATKGNGCYGYWRFKDQSYIYAMCDGSFVAHKPATDDQSETWWHLRNDQ